MSTTVMTATTSALANLAAEGGERALPMPPWAFGAIALGVVLLLLLVTWFFRHAAQAAIEGDAYAAHDPRTASTAHPAGPHGGARHGEKH